MKNSKALIKSIVVRMTTEELRSELIALAGANKRSAEDFILRHSKPREDAEGEALLEMVHGKANEIAEAIRKNTADNETAWQVAERRAGRRVFHEGGSFAVAIRDELKEAERYTAQLAKKGQIKLALEFARMAAIVIPAAIKASPCGVEWGFYARHLWEIILKETQGAARKEAFAGMLQEVEAEEEPDLDLWVLSTSDPDPELIPRVIALLDREIERQRKSEEDLCHRSHEPFELHARLGLMRKSGMEESEIDDYLVANFSDCDFTQELLLQRAEAEGDTKAVAAICQRLLSLKNLPADKRRECSEKLAQLQLASGDSAGQLETLRDAALKGAANLEDLRRLRALLPPAEWEAMLSGFIDAVEKDFFARPNFLGCCELLKDVGDVDRLWGLVQKSQRRSNWLAFADVLAPLHADACGDFLLSHLDRESESGSHYFFDTEPASETYARWAKVIKLASEIPGQREKAFKKAEAIAAARPRAWSMKAAWEKAGLPGFKTAAQKRAGTAKPKKN